jgi:hypothetical protein
MIQVGDLNAKKTLDHYIDDITAPTMDAILDIYKLEGAPFLSSFDTSAPWVERQQAYIASDAVKKIDTNMKYKDEWKTFTKISGEFSHAKPTVEKTKDGYLTKSYSHSAY